jgi:hypothetical protein
MVTREVLAYFGVGLTSILSTDIGLQPATLSGTVSLVAVIERLLIGSSRSAQCRAGSQA